VKATHTFVMTKQVAHRAKIIEPDFPFYQDAEKDLNPIALVFGYAVSFLSNMALK